MKVPSEEGFATYYDYPTQRYTANGDKFDPNAITCAYYTNCKDKNHLLNHYVKVESDYNYLIIKVTDTGAFKEYPYLDRNVIIDLTPAAFKILGGTKREGKLHVNVTLLN